MVDVDGRRPGARSVWAPAIVEVATERDRETAALGVALTAEGLGVDGGRGRFEDAGVVDGVAPTAKEVGVFEGRNTAGRFAFTFEDAPRVVDQAADLLPRVGLRPNSHHLDSLDGSAPVARVITLAEAQAFELRFAQRVEDGYFIGEISFDAYCYGSE